MVYSSDQVGDRQGQGGGNSFQPTKEVSQDSLDEVEAGFYLDPLTKRMFYIMVVKGKPLIPPWVKSQKNEWKRIKHKDD